MSQDLNIPGDFTFIPLPNGQTIPVALGTHEIFGASHQIFDPMITTFTVDAGRALTNACHSPAKAAGWWTDLATGEALTIDTPRFVSEKLCLVHSEISEAMEGHRKGLMDDKLPHRTMLEVELADAAIRIFDMAGGFGLDVAGAIAEKLLYNKTRADHKVGNRRAVGGKAF